MNKFSIKTMFHKLRKVLTVRRLLICLAALLTVGSCTVALVFGGRHITDTQAEIRNLKTEQTQLRDTLTMQQAAHTALEQQAIDTKKTFEDSLKIGQDKITALEAKIVDLEKKVANSLAPTVYKPAPAKSSSIYDRIISDSPDAKQKLIDAIKLIETNTPNYFTILKTHVQEIRTTTNIGCGGGQQIQRTIYISYTPGNCLINTPISTFASVVIHESYHVYNVYVNKVYPSGKVQELPSLYVQRETFDALGVVQPFRNYIESLIAYYESV